ncbi:DUF1810 domain-containing protein [Altererythrobacter sp. B11]|uniref:DUF1810 domain-containing protein n=1 Tax=Altererythrobacter sp. B11 TaxID=2060312 RepID=UPI002F930387
MTRFVQAQAGIYPRALEELRAGAKRSHWMWFIFPQIIGLGRSSTAQFYAIADLAEARCYLAHPLLGPRLEEATRAMLAWSAERSPEAILGHVDALKFHSSMTLFDAAAEGEGPYREALDSFYYSQRDGATTAIIGREQAAPSA